MVQTLVAQKNIPSSLKKGYSLVENEMNQVGTVLKELLSHVNPVMDEIVQYSFYLGGKRLRPLLVLLSALATGKIQRQNILAATALEMIHTGSLVHDDILDGAKIRRHLETINLHWDDKAAVLVGDLLISRAMELISECNSLLAYQAISSACKKTCEGELFQTLTRNRFELSIDDYMTIIGGKTASLLECCGYLGASFNETSEKTVLHFARFGYNLGIAFQIIDDILDLTGDESVVGKTLGTDLINHKPTLPLIYYLQQVSESERVKMLRLVEQERIDTGTILEIQALLKNAGMTELGRQKAETFIREAVALLEQEQAGQSSLSESQKTAFDALAEIASFVIERRW